MRQTSFFPGTRQVEAAHRADKAMEVAVVRISVSRGVCDIHDEGHLKVEYLNLLWCLESLFSGVILQESKKRNEGRHCLNLYQTFLSAKEHNP